MSKVDEAARCQQRIANLLQAVAVDADQDDFPDLVDEAVSWAEGADRDPLAAATKLGQQLAALADNLAAVRAAAPDAWPDLVTDLRANLPDLWHSIHHPPSPED